ncbi:hypothetical protein JX265_012249 [Neoarthrinium moseri]|uniref:NADH dehydrogenase [ubiquinone] 1 alpha subcomplex assembly factor 3 n=1 Tax=Neoarthrinium moseri TaxID=1658444 RepID=A0A9P9WAS6_9PEZI|nr:hypothetical protein JX265_012249 [Neoarthrinium moseri]
MASFLRPARAAHAPETLNCLFKQTTGHASPRRIERFATQTRPRCARPAQHYPVTGRIPFASSFHTSRRLRNDGSGGSSRTDLGALDVLANTPVPSNSIDICMASGFQLNNGARITDGSGVFLVSGEAFRWRPWEAAASASSATASPYRLLNKKGQYDIPAAALNVLAHLWPLPDLLVLGVGPENRPISPELRRAISALGIRVEVLDTRNAAAQFNLLVRERGVEDVAAALVPIGWVEGQGAGEGDEASVTHE